jgi:hypothetical protein
MATSSVSREVRVGFLADIVIRRKVWSISLIVVLNVNSLMDDGKWMDDRELKDA